MVLLSASACAADFTFGDLLGKGSFGVVHKVERKGAHDRDDVATPECGRYTVQSHHSCCCVCPWSAAPRDSHMPLVSTDARSMGARDVLADWGARRTAVDKKTLVSTRVVHPPPPEHHFHIHRHPRSTHWTAGQRYRVTHTTPCALCLGGYAGDQADQAPRAQAQGAGGSAERGERAATERGGGRLPSHHPHVTPTRITPCAVTLSGGFCQPSPGAPPNPKRTLS